MTQVQITIDTEYSSGLFESGIARSAEANFERCVQCKTQQGEAGIFYQMDVFSRNGITATFFVDPMPAMIWGNQAIERIVKPIVDRGHEVQLHLHTEWLGLAENPPLREKAGQNLADFSLEDQLILLEYAMEELVKAGAPQPVAFRAGNYGANDDTLRALAKLGITYDTSHPPGIEQSDCAISLGAQDFLPREYKGVVELPIGLIGARGGAARHAQITALSNQELIAGVRHAREQDWPLFVIVSHSFEFANRKRQVTNAIVKRRFEAFCEWLGSQEDIDTPRFDDLCARTLLDKSKPEKVLAGILPHSPARTAWRMGEQAVANALYG